MEKIINIIAYIIMPFVWAYNAVVLAHQLNSIMFQKTSLARLFWLYYKIRIDGADKVAHMYYIMVGAVVWLLCQIIPFLASIAGALFWLFLIGLVVTSILGIA